MNYYDEIKEKLMIEVGKKYNERTLYGMRKFFEMFSNEKLNALRSKLCWAHYREVLSSKRKSADTVCTIILVSLL